MESDLLIAVARHGQTDSNTKGLWVGSGDDPLNNVGIKQASELARYLSDFQFDYVISSDKKRAMQTAEIVSNALGVPIYGHQPVLRDREYGKLEGMTSEQIREKYGVEMKSLSREIDDLGATETVGSVLKRVREFTDTAKSTFAGKKIIVITHGAFIRSFYETHVRDSDGLRFTNCSHFIVRLKDGGSEVVRDLQTLKF
ncbi:MAG: histidine phosphatase family protein [Thermoplasmatales archaeon]|nr:histidine phosphatase family protein [Thermoplasmatales archaeon]